MRTAEEILNKFYKPGMHWKIVNLNNMISAINEARKEVIEECAKRVTVTDPYQDGSKIGLHGKNLENYIINNPPEIDKQSILSLINELK